MDVWCATHKVGYEPFSDEFDRIADITELVPKDRALEIVKFLSDYRIGRFERPPEPTDPDELLISLRNENKENELVAAIPRGTPRKHLFAFMKDAKVLEGSLKEEFSALGLSPEDTSVTFLIENSGTTRGEPAYHTAMSTIEMCKALDSLGVETAVLGYTSDSWKGGSSGKAWIAEGRPRNPGRLEDLLHIVYKRPDAPMDAAAVAWLHMLAEPKLKRENIFGEGLMWGAAAAATSERPSKLLVHVVNKPHSVSQATLAANDDADDMFRRHQEAIISEIDSSDELAMSLVVLSPTDTTLESARGGREAMGRMLVVSEGTGRADETLTAFRNGLVAAMERSMESRLVDARQP